MNKMEKELDDIIRDELTKTINKLYDENNKLNKSNEKLKADLKKMKVKYKDLTNVHSKFKDFISCLPYSVNDDGEV